VQQSQVLIGGQTGLVQVDGGLGNRQRQVVHRFGDLGGVGGRQPRDAVGKQGDRFVGVE